MLLGSGELGREVVIELMRLRCEVIAVDRYDNAPAQQVAHRAYTLPMLDADRLRAVIREVNPHFVVPEIEAIATEVLAEFEVAGVRVVPTARAAQLTMNREGIRRLAAMWKRHAAGLWQPVTRLPCTMASGAGTWLRFASVHRH